MSYRFHVMLLVIMVLVLCLVINSQNETIAQQQRLINSFRQDKACMHDTRTKHVQD